MAFSRALIVGLLCCCMLRAWALEDDPPLQRSAMAWNEEFAYLTGMQAFIYGYPIITFAELRAQPLPGGHSMVNRYFHTRHLADPAQKYGGSPNRDTAYSLAFADVSREPVVLTVPPNPERRYYSLQLCDMYSDTIGYIGVRATGNIPGDYLLTGPGWKGKVPKGMQQVIRAWTPWVAVFGRTYNDGTEEDLPRMAAFQDGYRITPLSAYRRKAQLQSGRVPATVASRDDPLGAFKTMNAAMRENPPPAGHASMMQQFALVGLGPEARQDFGDIDPAIQRGLRRAIVDGRDLLARVAKAGGSIVGATQMRNGWFYGPSNWGRMAASGDFLGRAGTQVFSGIVEHRIEESVKLRTFVDDEGRPLNGSNRYVIHFKKEEIPVARAFWSVTLYDEHYNLASNGAGRYTFGDKTPGLKYGPDGSLTVYIQPEPPEGEKAANWLPSAGGKDFNLFLRAYFPGAAMLDQSYAAPPVRRVAE